MFFFHQLILKLETSINAGQSLTENLQAFISCLTKVCKLFKNIQLSPHNSNMYNVAYL